MNHCPIGLCLFALIASGLMNVGPAGAQSCAQAGGTTRDQLKTAYFSLAGPQDRLDYRSIFKATKDPNKKFYIPHYRIRTEEVSGQLHYGIQLKSEGTDWLLMIPLESYSDLALGNSARTAQPINEPANYKVYLTYNIPGAGTQAAATPRRLEFSEVQIQPWGMQARLRRTTLPDQDELYNALTNSSYSTRLVVAHSIDIGFKRLNSAEIERLKREQRAVLDTFPVSLWFFDNSAERYPIWDGDNYRNIRNPRNPVSLMFNQSGNPRNRLQSLSAPEGLSAGDPLDPRQPLAVSGDMIIFKSTEREDHVFDPNWLFRSYRLRSPFRPMSGPPDPRPYIQLVIWKIKDFSSAIRHWSDDAGFSKFNENKAFSELCTDCPIYYGDVVAFSLPLMECKKYKAYYKSEDCPGDFAHTVFSPFLFWIGHPEPGDLVSSVQKLVREIKEKWQQFSALIEQENNCFSKFHVDLEESVPPAPLYLDPGRHGYVYHGVMPRGGTLQQGLIRRQVNGRSYYQSEAVRKRFYYLPDKFELEWLPGCKRCPNMSVRAAQAEDKYLVDYVARPVVDQTRLQAVSAKLLAYAREGGSNASEVDFEPFIGQSNDIRFILRVPDAQTRDRWREEERRGALDGLASNIKDSLTLNADELKGLFNGLMGASATLFTGTIRLNMQSFAEEQIPFEGRVAGLVTPEEKETIWNTIYKPEIATEYRRSVEVKTSKDAFQGVNVVQVIFKDGGMVTLTSSSPGAATTLRAPIGDFVLDRDSRGGAYQYRLRVDGLETKDEWRSSDAAILRIQKADIQYRAR